MKRMAVVLAVFGFLIAMRLVGTPGTRAPEMTEAEMSLIEAEVREAIERRWGGFRSAILDSDYERWQSFWTADARVIEPGADMAGNVFFDAVRGFLAAGGEIQSFEPETSETFLHGSTAYQIGHYTETVQPPGREPMEGEMFFFIRWERSPSGEWKISRFLRGPRDAPAEG
jgi:hypothetical protein